MISVVTSSNQGGGRFCACPRSPSKTKPLRLEMMNFTCVAQARSCTPNLNPSEPQSATAPDRSRGFAAQYQQSPVPPGGAMIRREWLRYYEKPPERTYVAKVIQSWDTASKDGAQNDWSVCTTWMLVDNRYYLLDLTRGRYDYPISRQPRSRWRKSTVHDALIEDASTGTALAQEFRDVYFDGAVRLVPIGRDKIGRLMLTTIVAAERVGRRAYGLEIDPRYIDVAVRRWQAYTGRDAVLGTGETFDEVAALRSKTGRRHD